jgi:hypothetical protein
MIMRFYSIEFDVEFIEFDVELIEFDVECIEFDILMNNDNEILQY